MSISFSPSTAMATTNAVYITLEPEIYPKDVVQAAWEVRNCFDTFAARFKEYRRNDGGVELSQVRALHRDVVTAVRELEILLGTKLMYED